MFRLIAFTGAILSALMLMVGLVLMLYVFPHDSLINQSLHVVNATVASERDVYKICSSTYSCGCNNGKCQTCTTTYVCWDHYLTFEYTPDPELVLINTTQFTEIFMWNDQSPSISSQWPVGKITDAYYNVCAFIPKYHNDTIVCENHGDTFPFYLYLFDDHGMYAGSIACLVLSGLFALPAIAYLCRHIQCRIPKFNVHVIDIPLPHVVSSPPVVVYMPEQPPDYDTAISSSSTCQKI